MKKKNRRKLAELEWYKSFSMHFSVFCGVLTIIGLIVGVYSYYKTIKPYLDLKNLEDKVEVLENENKELTDSNFMLKNKKDALQKENSQLESKRDQLSDELTKKEDFLVQMKDEIITAQADAFMSPIIYQSMYNSIYSSKSTETVKQFTLKQLKEYSKENDINENKIETLRQLSNFVNEKLNDNSNFGDLLGYRVYLYEKKLSEFEKK